MRRYKDLVAEYVDHGFSPEYWEALPVATYIIKLIEEEDYPNASALLVWGIAEFPGLGGCLVDELITRLGKKPKPKGAPIRNTDQRLVGIYDYYRMHTQGSAAERLMQLAEEYKLAPTTMEDLLKAGRKLARKLEADRLASLDEEQRYASEPPDADSESWDRFIERVKRHRQSPI